MAPQRRRASWPGILIGALVFVSAAALGWFLVFSEAASGGAASPDAAVQELAAAINGDDPYLVMQAVAPSEVEGVADLLRTIQQRLEEQGVDSWAASDSDVSNVDVVLDLTTVEMIEEVESAALVEIDGTIIVDASRVTGPVGEALDDQYEVDLGEIADDLGDEGIDELTITVVKEGGGWYVSPLMTAFTLASQSEDLDVDLDRVDDAVVRSAKTPQEAAERAIEAGTNLDFDELKDVVTPAASGVLLVYDELFQRADDEAGEAGYDVTDFDVTTRDLGDGLVAIEEVGVDASTFDDITELTIDGDCVEVDDNRECVLDGFDGKLDHGQIVLRTMEIDGGFAVDPIASISTMIDDLVRNIEYEWWLSAFGLERYASGTPVQIGVETQLDFGGKPFAVVEFTPVDGAVIETAVFGEYDWFDEFRKHDGVWGDEYRGRTEPASDDPMRVVIAAPRRDDGCSGLFCSDTDGQVTFVAHAAQRQRLSGPDQQVTADLRRGDGFIFEFDVSEPTAVDFVAEQGDVSVQLFDATGGQVDGSLQPGAYELHVWNESDVDTTFTVAPRLRAVQTFSSGPIVADVFVGSGYTETFTFEPGSVVDVYVTGTTGVDLVVDVVGGDTTTCVDMDYGLTNEPESCTGMPVARNGTITVSAYPYNGVPDDGAATIEIYPG